MSQPNQNPLPERYQPDLIVGLALLVNMGHGLWFIYVICQKGNGERDYTWLCARPRGAPKPMPTASWEFERDGKFLHVTPSVHNIKTGFHNSYQWAVEFVEVNPEVDNIDLKQLHVDLNGSSATEVKRILRHHIDEGILLPILLD